MRPELVALLMLTAGVGRPDGTGPSLPNLQMAFHLAGIPGCKEKRGQTLSPPLKGC